MDALDVLYSDHLRIRSLLSQLGGMENFKQQRTLLTKIRTEFQAYTDIEERIFFPPLLRHDDFQPLINNFLKANEKARKQLAQAETEKDEQKFTVALNDAVEIISNSINEQHHQLFPMIRRLMKRPERDQLGRHIAAAKADKKSVA